MLYSTYREVVLPEEAERYWKLVPDVRAANVVAFSAISSNLKRKFYNFRLARVFVTALWLESIHDPPFGSS
jgi:hypothetical protein